MAAEKQASLCTNGMADQIFCQIAVALSEGRRTCQEWQAKRSIQGRLSRALSLIGFGTSNVLIGQKSQMTPKWDFQKEASQMQLPRMVIAEGNSLNGFCTNAGIERILFFGVQSWSD